MKVLDSILFLSSCFDHVFHMLVKGVALDFSCIDLLACVCCRVKGKKTVQICYCWGRRDASWDVIHSNLGDVLLVTLVLEMLEVIFVWVKSHSHHGDVISCSPGPND